MCCRSVPRCSGCPVLTASATRRGVVAEILAGPAPRELPLCVRDALGALETRRAEGLAVQRLHEP